MQSQVNQYEEKRKYLRPGKTLGLGGPSKQTKEADITNKGAYQNARQAKSKIDK